MFANGRQWTARAALVAVLAAGTMVLLAGAGARPAAADSQFTVEDVSVAEGNSGTTRMSFTIKWTNPNTWYGTEAKIRTQGGTATAGTDYTEIQDLILSFAAGESEKVVDVSVTGDVVLEGDETLIGTVSSRNWWGGWADSDSAVGTIVNDDSVSVAVGDASVAEGRTRYTPDGRFVNVPITVTGAHPNHPTVVSYATQAYSGSAWATDGADFRGVSGELTFEQTTSPSVTKYVPVFVYDDSIVDRLTEVFPVRISSTSYRAQVTNAYGMVTIRDNDNARVAVANKRVTEGDSRARQSFAVTLDQPVPDGSVTVSYRVRERIPVEAVNGQDFVAASGTLTFAAGERSKAALFMLLGDLAPEDDERFVIELHNLSGRAVYGSQIGVVTVDDNEQCTIRAVAGQTTVGTSGADVICGTSGVDEIYGRGGNDKIYGFGDRDFLFGEGGSDRLFGGNGSFTSGDGNDKLFGGSGNDLLHGENGNDILFGNAGRDVLDGDAGHDRLSDKDRESNTLRGGTGNDRFSTGDGVRDRLYGESGTDTGCVDGHDTDSWSSVEQIEWENPTYMTDWCAHPEAWAQFH